LIQQPFYGLAMTRLRPLNHLFQREKTPGLRLTATLLCYKIIQYNAMGGHVYIMSSLNHSTLYTGVTSNLPARVAQHKEKAYPNSFSARYNCVKLVYYNWFDTILEAIAEEKRIKGGSRKKKEILINSMNPEWKDLYQETRFR